LKRDSVPQLHQSIGPDYVQALIVPEIGNRMREVIAEYTAEDALELAQRAERIVARYLIEDTLDLDKLVDRETLIRKIFARSHELICLSREATFGPWR
jgi:hypothetical protein